ncbi:MAG: NAD(P) transhydrogenase subunit alpha [Ilumatobacteraceae bacterium]
MRIGVVGTESGTDDGERRVAVTPDVATRLIGRGHQVEIATRAGTGAGHTDDDYTAVGARIVDEETAWTADLVATVGRPSLATPVPRAVIGLLRPFDDPAGLAELASRGAILFAFEAVPRTTRAQVVDALSSQATVLGYQGVLEAAARSDRLFPMLTTAAGTIRPSKVLVLGAGVAGLQAIATARRLGASVSAFDVRAAAAEQVRSLGATFVEIDAPSQDATASGGYAQAVGRDEQDRIIAGLAPHVAAADVVITSAAIPGRRAPVMIDAATLAGMRRGAVIVDLAASTGGNCAATEPGRTIQVEGVTVIGDLDLVGRVARDASAMYARNVAAFVDLVTADDGSFHTDWDDDIVAGSCVARDGVVVHPLLTARSTEAP